MLSLICRTLHPMVKGFNALLGCKHSHVSASDSQIIRSADGDASIRPSGDQAMRPIVPVCPRSVRMSFTPGGRFFRTSSSARSHCLTDPSLMRINPVRACQSSTLRVLFSCQFKIRLMVIKLRISFLTEDQEDCNLKSETLRLPAPPPSAPCRSRAPGRPPPAPAQLSARFPSLQTRSSGKPAHSAGTAPGSRPLTESKGYRSSRQNSIASHRSSIREDACARSAIMASSRLRVRPLPQELRATIAASYISSSAVCTNYEDS